MQHDRHNDRHNTPKIQIANNVKHINYRDTETLKTFLNPHARLMGRKRTGLSGAHQRMVAQAVKRARFMGFLPYVQR